MGKSKHLVWLVVHAAMALTLAVGVLWPLPDVRLYGVEAPKPPPRFSLAAWWHERTQGELQAWFESHLGFRGAMVRTDNTAVNLVGETKLVCGSKVGNDGVLFLDHDLSYASARVVDTPSHEILTTIGNLAGSVQRKLAARGKSFVVVISPSKTSIYPDAIPERWKRRTGDHHADAFVHDGLVSEFRKNGVRFVDAVELLGHYRGQEREDRFGKMGRHWTTVGACETFRALAEWRSDVDCSFGYHAVPLSNEVQAVDYDLLRLQNAWNRGDEVTTTILTGTAPPGPRPKMLLVGTSFSWMMIHAARPYVGESWVFYYNETVYDVEAAPKPIEHVDPTAPSWARYVMDQDVYVLELLETYAHGEYVVGFLRQLDNALPPPSSND